MQLWRQTRIFVEYAVRKQAGTLLPAEAAMHSWTFFFFQGRLISVLKTFQLIESGPPRLSKKISFTQSQLIMNFNHIYKIPSQQHLDQSLIK